jgi:hypothetical protein
VECVCASTASRMVGLGGMPQWGIGEECDLMDSCRSAAFWRRGEDDCRTGEGLRFSLHPGHVLTENWWRRLLEQVHKLLSLDFS